MNFAVANQYRIGKSCADKILTNFEILGPGFFGGSILGFFGFFYGPHAFFGHPNGKKRKKKCKRMNQGDLFFKVIDMTRAFPSHILGAIANARLMPIFRHRARYGLKMANNNPFLTYFGHFRAQKSEKTQV